MGSPDVAAEVEAGSAQQPPSVRALLAEPLDELPQLVYVKDGSGRYLRVNARFESVMATSAAELLGRTDEELPPLVTIDGPRLSEGGPLRADSAHLSYVVDAVADRPDLSVWRFALPGPGGAPAGTCAVAAPVAEASAAGAACERLLAVATAAAPVELEVAPEEDGDDGSAELDTLVEERDRLAKERDRLAEERDRLAEGLASVSREADQARAKVEHLARNLEDRQLEVDELWTALDRERGASAAIRDELASTQDQLRAAQHHLAAAQQGKSSADQLGTAARHNLGAARQELAAAREQAEGAIHERDRARQQAADAARERDEARQTVVTVSRERDEARQIAVTASRERDDATENARVARRERDQLREALAAATRDRDQSREADAAMVRERDQARERARELARERDDARADTAAAIRERDEARTAITAAQDQLASAAAEINDLRGELASARTRAASPPPTAPAPVAPSPPPAPVLASEPAAGRVGWGPSAQRTLAARLASATEWPVALRAVVTTLGEEGDWQAAVAWMPDARSSRLRCAAMWVDPTAELAPLETATWQQMPRSDDDDIATALHGVAAVSTIELDPEHRLAKMARDHGLRHAVRVRVGPRGQAIALLELLTDTPPTADGALAVSLEAVAIQLGQVAELMRLGAQPRWAMGRF